jgi:hypothetical protein
LLSGHHRPTDFIQQTHIHTHTHTQRKMGISYIFFTEFDVETGALIKNPLYDVRKRKFESDAGHTTGSSVLTINEQKLMRPLPRCEKGAT